MATRTARAWFVALVLCSLGVGGCALSNDLARTSAPSEASWAQVDNAIETRVRERAYSGAVFAVARRERVLHRGAIGLADIDAHTPMQNDTIFRQMSLTKPVTAVGVMILVDEGRIDLDAPIQRYLPELSGYELDGVTVTVRHLLTHTSGFGVFGTIPPTTPDLTLEARIHQLAARRPVSRPGTQWQYSGFDGFDILARIIEVTANEPYAAFMERRVFGPLGMQDTTFSLTAEQRARLAELYGSRNGEIQATPPTLLLPAYPAGGAGLYSTAPDMLRLAQMLANRGRLGSSRILSPSAVDELRREQLPPGFSGLTGGLAWGLGVRVVNDPAQAHSSLNRGAYGWSGAYGTHLWIDPETGVAAVWMISTSTGGGAGSPHAEEYERLVVQALAETR